MSNSEELHTELRVTITDPYCHKYEEQSKGNDSDVLGSFQAY